MDRVPVVQCRRQIVRSQQAQADRRWMLSSAASCRKGRSVLAGNAMMNPFTAQVLRDTPADLISVKLGINVVNGDVMRLRAFLPAVHGFLDAIREGHPETPLVLISPIFCGIHEDTPGPGAFDPASFGTGQIRFVATGSPEDVAAGQLTLRVIREALA